MLEIRSRQLIAALALILCAACASSESRLVAGGVYSFSNGDGSFGVLKVLAIDPDAVSVRLYRESFDARPADVDRGGLTLGAIDDEDGFGLGHLPLKERDLALTFPVLLFEEPVLEDELVGYRMWREAGGGAFEFTQMDESELEQLEMEIGDVAEDSQ